MPDALTTIITSTAVAAIVSTLRWPGTVGATTSSRHQKHTNHFQPIPDTAFRTPWCWPRRDQFIRPLRREGDRAYVAELAADHRAGDNPA